MGGGLVHWGTLSRSSPLAQEHWFGLGTSFHTSFFILEKKWARDEDPRVSPSSADLGSILTGSERGSG